MSIPKEYDFDPRNLPQELLQAIGLGVASAAQSQHMIEHAIWGCLGLDVEYGMAVTTHMTNPFRMNVLKAAAEIRIDEPALLDELDELLECLDSAMNRRNDFAHQCWARDPDTGDVFTVKDSARGSVTTELLPQSIDKIKLEAIAIYDAGIALWTFLMRNDLLPAIPPLRPRSHKIKSARKKRRERDL